MGGDSIDIVISYIDMGYLDTLLREEQRKIHHDVEGEPPHVWGWTMLATAPMPIQSNRGRATIVRVRRHHAFALPPACQPM